MRRIYCASLILIIFFQSLIGPVFADTNWWSNGLKNLSGGVKGVKADFDVADRHTSSGADDNSVVAIEGKGGIDNNYTSFGWEITDAPGFFGLYLHVVWPDGSGSVYPISPWQVSNGSHNLKVERNDSTGKWAAYLDYGNPKLTFNWPYYSTNTTETTQVEVGVYSGALDDIHAGTGKNVALKAANNTWYTQYSYWDVFRRRESTNSTANPFKTIINTPDYNWEATQQN